ncbi:MAG: murein transglycosylase A [Alphaproteobacteria bacterium]|nr:murein transglycosylase A [Alphaproteobacteria bacterium]
MADDRSRRRAATAAGLLLFLLLSACAPKAPPPPHLELTRAAFSDLPGWRDGNQAASLPALLRSCAALAKLPDDAKLGVGGLARDWRKPCAEAASLDHPTDAAARQFFESAFAPYAMTDNGKSDALVTGYYEPEISAARQKSARFDVPILARPPDLVGVSLGDFRPSWRGERIAGRVVDGKLVPYWTRAEIEAGALDRFHLALFYATDPTDLFFLQIQGSGRVRLPDGTAIEIGYDGENGRAYVALGRILVKRGAMTLDQVSMQSIETWLRAHPADAKALMDENPSYVFFRVLAGGAPLGSEGVALTSQHSVAVDPRFVPLGLPLWLDVAQGETVTRRLAVAQDTGAAIKGPLRADLFCGTGASAAAQAGPLRATGRLFLLLPQIGVTQG